MKRLLLALAVLICFTVLVLPAMNQNQETGAAKIQKSEIKLVLTVVIDQLRADWITRMQDRFGEGGFRYLVNSGVWFKEARYPYCTTITSVGHASIYTGSTPSEHGIIGNSWFDKQTGEEIKSTDIPDPQNPGKTITGPSQIIGSTIGDELVLASNNKSRVFGVSVKDRGAALPAGHLGKAFWYNMKSGEFVTTNYYYPNQTWPQWVKEWNQQKPADQYKKRSWSLFHPDASTYIFADADDRPEEKTYSRVFSNRFPHDFSHCQADKKYNFYAELTQTPFGDALTLDFAKRLIKEEKVGQGKYTDLLAISFSCTDAIGHTYGPFSLEYEDNILQLDALLAQLFKYVDENIGLEHTLIVVTADHGVDLIPEYRQRLKMKAGRINPDDFARVIDATLSQKYTLKDEYKLKSGKGFTLGFKNPSIFLNLNEKARQELNIKDIQAEAARAVSNLEGIAIAVSWTDIMSGKIIDAPWITPLKLAFHPKRCGDILVMQEPFYYLYHSHDKDSAMHGAPYTYDNHVPLFFAGPGIQQQTVYRRVSPTDIVPTIAQILGIEAPARSPGTLLIEVLKK